MKAFDFHENEILVMHDEFVENSNKHDIDVINLKWLKVNISIGTIYNKLSIIQRFRIRKCPYLKGMPFKAEI